MFPETVLSISTATSLTQPTPSLIISLSVLLAPLPRPTESEVAQSCLTVCDPVDCSPPGSSIHGILQARILAWVAISFSRGSSQPRDRTQVSHIAGRRFNLYTTRVALMFCLCVLQSPFMKKTQLLSKPSFAFGKLPIKKQWVFPFVTKLNKKLKKRHMSFVIRT